jgi:cobalt-zinc-cadmium efflux system membrane fusion protein
MKLFRYTKHAAVLVVAGAVVGVGYAARGHWLPLVTPTKPAEKADAAGELGGSAKQADKVIVGEQAQLNLGLTAKALLAQTYWKTLQLPGMVVDRPGQSDRGVVAPATGVIARVNHFPGDTVRPGDVLFTLKLLSESLLLTQSDLFKATQDITLAQAQRKRLKESGGAVPESRVIEVDNQIARLEVAVKAYRQELLNRGFGTDMIDGIAGGTFVNEIAIVVPPRPPAPSLAVTSPARPSDAGAAPTPPPTFEVQELRVDLGQQVQAGQTLCLVANHQKLAVEGKAFRDETQLLEQSVTQKWPVEVDFQEDPAAAWGDVNQSFRIRQMANTIDPVTRTFAFRMPLENQSRAVEDEGRTQTLWRFRPGQKVRLLVRVEKLDNVFVLPADAVAREGSEAFVFTQNVNTFTRKPVRVLLHDRRQVVLVNDGSLLTGTYVVQGGAEQLNRMLKSGGSGDALPEGYHIHADGSLHKNEDEGK